MTLNLTEFRERILALPEDLFDSERSRLLSELLDQLPENDDRNLTLEGWDFSGLKLKDADFAEADLSRVDFRDTDLRGASLFFAKLTDAQMNDGTQLSNTIGLLDGWKKNDGDKIQPNTIHITPNIQFPDDVVLAFQKAIKTNSDFWNEYTYEDPMVEVTVKHLTLKLPAEALEAFKTSIQNQIKNLFISKVKSLGNVQEYTGTDFTPSEPGELEDTREERKKTLNAMIEKLRDKNGIFDLSETSLTGLDLRGLNLHKTDFSRCDLRGACLDDAILTDIITDDETKWDSESQGQHERR